MSAWQDNKTLSVAATIGDPTMSVQVLRKKKDGTQTTVNCPQSISLYNKFIEGVDHNDQLRGYYHVRLKCRKYYKYVFWFLFDVAVINNYIAGTTLTSTSKMSRRFAQSLYKGFGW